MNRLRFLPLAFLLATSGLLSAQYTLVPRTTIDPGFTYTASPDDWRDINVYQLFTDRFYDGDSSNNNARTMRAGSWWTFNSAYSSGNTDGRSWYNTSNSAQSNDRHLWQGGDWEGIRQKIPYLQSMGIKAVWISSVQRVEQGVDKRFTPYHAYHPTNLYECEPMFGDFAKLRQLVDELHAAGIYVILDVVPNHMADLIRNKYGNENYNAGATTNDIDWADGVQHAAPFNRLDWFHPNGNIGNYDAYPETQWGGFKGTDDLNTDRADVQAELANAFKNLMDATDCDGFRVDAIKHVDHNWIKSWATDIRNHAASLGKNDFLIFGELFSFDDNFHSFFTQDQGSGFNSAMWFTMMNTMNDVFAGSGATQNLTGPLNNIWNNNLFGAEAAARSIAFIDNHDVDRICKNYTTTWGDMLRPAMGLLYLATPVPTIYYGTEHGFNQGQANNNPGADDGDYQRECMMDYGYQWGNAQGDKFNAASGIKDLIGQLNQAREQYICLRRGSFAQRWQTGGRGIYAFTRSYGDQEALVILNTDWSSQQSATPAVGKPDGTVFTNLLNPSETATVSGGTLNLTVPTRGLKVFAAGAPSLNLVISGTSNYPATGSILPIDDIYVDSRTGPKGAAVSGTLHYSTDGGGNWQSTALARNPTFDTPSTDAWNANLGQFAAGTSISYYVTFQDGESSTYTDDNNGVSYQLAVSSPPVFTMDGLPDSANYLVADNGMRIWAAVKGTKLYFATWSTEGGNNDHFLLCSNNFGNPEVHPWSKDGTVNFWFGGWPWLAADGTFQTLNNGGASGSSAMGTGGNVLEGEIDLVEVFGSVPKILYFSALSYGDNDGDGINGQCPAPWSADNNLTSPEYAAVRVDSIRDEDGDGWHDAGNPAFSSTVGDDTADANYGLRRFFLNERSGETADISFAFTPNLNPSETISNVELITNLNRRDHAAIQEGRDSVTTSSDTYYRAYPMTDNGGVWEADLTVSKCGAYRATVRYFVDGEGPFYFTDNGLRRDLAIVVSPRKSLDVNMYEVNPSIVEATGDGFAGRSTFRDLWMANGDRPDYVNTDHFTNLGVNMLWLQPIHPIGVEARGEDPATSAPYEPGSPYAVRDYWQVAPALGADNTESGAMTEFQTAVAQFDTAGIGVMMDGTFNHSAPDAVLGQGAADLFPWATVTGAEIRSQRPQWYSKEGDFSNPASIPGEVAVAPDRSDFGKWTDVRDFYFGDYDALVKYASESHKEEFLLERDDLETLPSDTVELWKYFAHYPIYWLEKTGHPAGTPASESYKGIDGLRCDFAQGLPSEFWEYCINTTRSVKWDFLFMAESLDGYREIGGSKRHGVGYRSARHFDILNENMVFHWRDTHFAYPANGVGSAGTSNRSTVLTHNAYDNRRQAYEGVVLLNNLTSHDEVFPSNDPYELLQAYAQLGALDGIPMLLYGQEAGAQNDVATYGFSGIANADHNFLRYELNFGKSIPNFKRWNAMTPVWSNRNWTVQTLYGRVNRARLLSPALRGKGEYFLSRTGGAGTDPNIFAVAKFNQAGVPVSQQHVVLAFANTDYEANSNRSATFDLSAEVSPGVNWFGIEPGSSYNAVDLLSADPTTTVWALDRTGADLIANGIPIELSAPVDSLGQAKYLRLIDTAVPLDSDSDGIPDAWEDSNGLDKLDPADPIDDDDLDGYSNLAEYYAGTDPQDRSSLLRATGTTRTAGGVLITWASVPGRSYRIEWTDDFGNWQPLMDGGNPVSVPASGGSTTSFEVPLADPPAPSKRFYRIAVP
ncbi:MAG: hypothetical protein H7A48_13135 [Akkermansiaceae bacterium]|nr:hypothetical protein [Akkermansiaceae bacterium]